VQIAVQVDTPLKSMHTACAMSVKMAQIAAQLEALGALTAHVAKLKSEVESLGALTVHQGRDNSRECVLGAYKVGSKVFLAPIRAIGVSRGDTVPAMPQFIAAIVLQGNTAVSRSFVHFKHALTALLAHGATAQVLLHWTHVEHACQADGVQLLERTPKIVAHPAVVV